MTPEDAIMILLQAGKIRSRWLPGMLLWVTPIGPSALVIDVPDGKYIGDLVVSFPDVGVVWYGYNRGEPGKWLGRWFWSNTDLRAGWRIAGNQYPWPDRWEYDRVDVCTTAALLALLREATGNPKLTVVPDRELWVIAGAGPPDLNMGIGTTEQEAVVAALVAIAGSWLDS